MIIIQETVAIISARFYFSVKFHETLLAKKKMNQLKNVIS